ncbi:MAG: hypothetical protein QXR76_03310 [Candidatus Bathyarchaeia archaeon]
MNKVRKSGKHAFIETTDIEKIGLTYLLPLKSGSRVFYITIPPNVVRAYKLLPGDLLKINLIEVRKTREHEEEQSEDKF